MSTRNPKWQSDEIILALNLYFSPDRGSIDSKNPKIIALSQTLNDLEIVTNRPDAEKFRNPNGVTLKLSNFRAVDPEYTKQGKKGMTGGSKLDEELFKKYRNDLPQLKKLAESILKINKDAALVQAISTIEEDETIWDDAAVEGQAHYKIHKYRERSRSIVKKKIQWAWSKFGKLTCEVCDFDFEEHYGELGRGFIECHHRVPLSKLETNTITKIDNLALVCSNCHRILHKDIDNLSVESLREMLHR
ncbi:HNH endonuclease [Pseudoflavitalea sp. G-6-1-2]|uniref:HNH endonuclease n=1 Tax=Pseudoflavitalea sp. G-6-1-2 TaxID=2728841 RepID=UPI00146F1B89|nr:HNH endonuclease [Pseudoflavitalea sp. G-6-1-2]NML23044.1 HNH endonuclease [Pseudoflavitalea sp. G-6-1-2]